MNLVLAVFDNSFFYINSIVYYVHTNVHDLIVHYIFKTVLKWSLIVHSKAASFLFYCHYYNTMEMN